VDKLSFEVGAGESVGLLGPNGAGKTTTIHLLLGLIKPDAGRITVLGLDLAQDRRRVLQRVNLSSADLRLPTNLTVWENLLVFARLYGLARPKARIEALLELFEIGATKQARTGALSTGQMTRLNLAKALLNDPEILFLDEPTASLDPDIAAKVRETLARLQAERGLTILYTSHNMAEVEQMCRRILFLHRGRVVAQGSPAEVTALARSTSLEEAFIALARRKD
jgi:ABC-2 type transport system ATP-binding protein